MKLNNRFLFFITISISIILSVWAVLFYYSILEEVYDEVDDQLDNYAQLIMTSFLSGSMSEFYSGDGSNNTFELYEISQETAKKKPKLRYYESMIYIKSKHENEPARVLDTYFVNAENVCQNRTRMVKCKRYNFEKDYIVALRTLYNK